jgi:hypothetical protein
MSSRAQIDAHRANARKSIGPRTESGKARVAQNAVRHGLFSRRLILPGDDPKEFGALHDAFYARFKPADSIEAICVDRMILASWKMARLQRAEAIDVELWAEDLTEAEDRMEPAEQKCRDFDIAAHVISTNFHRHERFSRHQFALERSMDKSLAELRKLQKERRENLDADANPDAPGDGHAILDSESVSTPDCEKTNPVPASREKAEEFKPNSAEEEPSVLTETNPIELDDARIEEFKPSSNPTEAPERDPAEPPEGKMT